LGPKSYARMRYVAHRPPATFRARRNIPGESAPFLRRVSIKMRVLWPLTSFMYRHSLPRALRIGQLQEPFQL
jgi:hypothetical protein